MTRSALSMPIAAIASLALIAPAGALTLTPNYGSSLTSQGNALAVESAITNAIGAIDALYSNNANIPVLFLYDSGLGGGASTSSAIFSNITYNSWRNSLATDSTAHPENTALSTAVAHLPAPGTVTQTMSVTAPYFNAVMGQSLSLCFNGSGSFVSGCGASYAAVVTLSGTSVAVIEHELNEVLGGGGGGTTLTNASVGTPTAYGTTDLFRYQSLGSTCAGPLGGRSWSTNSGLVTCYSIDGGNSAITDQAGNPVRFNQAGGGSDYADWNSQDSTLSWIQDAFVPATTPLPYTAGSPEYIMMTSIGYNPAAIAAPEPVSLALMLSGITSLAVVRRRRK